MMNLIGHRIQVVASGQTLYSTRGIFTQTTAYDLGTKATKNSQK